ncbi:MAG TPA: FliM/FliN family flagellar motor switch protein [Phycisphaerae bacterium]|nr:FliM/FliN family flagellar motor switch protein [Phycisphaerae bacterium]
MPASDDLDAVLADAKNAVDTLAGDLSRLTGVDAPVTAQPGFQSPGPSTPQSLNPSIPQSLPPHLRRILRLKVPVSVRVAERTMPVGEVLKFGPGRIVEFDQPVDAELDLLVANQQIGTGVAVKYNEHFGVRVNFIGDVRQRIESLI